MFPNINESVLVPAAITHLSRYTAAVSASVSMGAMAIGIAVITVSAILCTLTLGGNILVIVAIFIDPKLWTPSNYFLISLGISDCWVGLASLPIYTLYLLKGKWIFSQFLCKLWICLDLCICGGGLGTLFFITLDRYLSVVIPIKYRNWRSGKKILFMIAFSWAFPTSIFPALVLFYIPEGYTRKPDICEIPYLTEPWFAFGLAIAIYWVMTSMMCYFYWKIYTIAKASDKGYKKPIPNAPSTYTPGSHTGPSTSMTKTSENESHIIKRDENHAFEKVEQPKPSFEKDAAQETKVSFVSDMTDPLEDNPLEDRNRFMSEGSSVDQQEVSRWTRYEDGIRKSGKTIRTDEVSKNVATDSDEDNVKNQHAPRSRKTLTTITLILGAYLICWSPLHIVYLLPALCGYDCVNVLFFALGYWLCYANSAINPFLYAYANDRIKQTTLKLLKCRCK